jgi:hypothetical protein
MTLSNFFQTLLHGKKPSPSLPPAIPSNVHHDIHPHHKPLLIASTLHAPIKSTYAEPAKVRVMADEDTDEPSLLTTIVAMELADDAIHSASGADIVGSSRDDAPAFAGFSGGDFGGAGATTDDSPADSPADNSSSDTGNDF